MDNIERAFIDGFIKKSSTFGNIAEQLAEAEKKFKPSVSGEGGFHNHGNPGLNSMEGLGEIPHNPFNQPPNLNSVNSMEGMADPEFKYQQPSKGEFLAQQRHNPLALATVPKPGRWSGNAQPFNDTINKILGKLKSVKGTVDKARGWVNEHPVKALGTTVAAGVPAAHYGGKALGNLSVPSPKNILKDPIAANLAEIEMERKRNSFSTSNLFDMLTEHVKNHKLPYGIGIGAAGLGGLGYLAHNKYKKNKDKQITESGEDQPGGDPEIMLQNEYTGPTTVHH